MPDFPQTDAVPVQLALQLKYSISTDVVVPQRIKLVPKNLDGTIFDATNLSQVIVNIDNNQLDHRLVTAKNLNPATRSGDTTGITFDLVNADLSVLPLLYAYGGRLTVIAFDGTNHVIVATGSWNMVNVA